MRWRMTDGRHAAPQCGEESRFDQDQSVPSPLRPILRATEGRAMSKSDIIVLAGIVGAFVAFMIGIAWAEYASRHA